MAQCQEHNRRTREPPCANRPRAPARVRPRSPGGAEPAAALPRVRERTGAHLLAPAPGRPVVLVFDPCGHRYTSPAPPVLAVTPPPPEAYEGPAPLSW